MNAANYKKKNQLLLIGSVLFLFICYWFSFKDTIGLWSEVQELEHKMIVAKDAPQKVAIMQDKLASMNMLTGIKQSTDSEIEQELLGVVTSYCKSSGVVLRDFPKTLVSSEGDFRIETNVFTIEGGYAKLLALVYLLEQKSKIGKVSSVQYISKKDLRTKALTLTATIYLQNIKKNTNEI